MRLGLGREESRWEESFSLKVKGLERLGLDSVYMVGLDGLTCISWEIPVRISFKLFSFSLLLLPFFTKESFRSWL